MKALIFENKVIQLENEDFPVSEPLLWVDVPSDLDVKTGWSYESDTFVEPAVSSGLTIADLENALGLYRSSYENGGIDLFGQTIATDAVAQTKLIGARIAALEDSDYTVNWRGENGFVTLDAPTLIIIADTVRDYVQRCYDAEGIVLPLVLDETYTTIEEIEDAYDAAFLSLSST